jgi:hypothetical protein
MTEKSKKDTCCPKFEPQRWDKKSYVWKDKLFIKDKVIQFFHIPLNMAQVVKRMFAKIQKVNAAPKDEDFLMLAYDPSPWISELHMTVTKEVPDAEMVKLSGEFFSMVFDGPYNAVPKWIVELKAYLDKENKPMKKIYVHYAYCPKCAEKYGKNYAIVFAQIK